MGCGGLPEITGQFHIITDTGVKKAQLLPRCDTGVLGHLLRPCVPWILAAPKAARQGGGVGLYGSRCEAPRHRSSLWAGDAAEPGLVPRAGCDRVWVCST